MCEPVLFVYMSVSVPRLWSKSLAEHRQNVYESISFIKAEKLQLVIEWHSLVFQLYKLNGWLN